MPSDGMMQTEVHDQEPQASMTDVEFKQLQTKWSSFKSYVSKKMSAADLEAKQSLVEAYSNCSKDKKKAILLAWVKAGGTKANVTSLAKQVMEVTLKGQDQGNYGLMTPCRVAELARISRECYPSLDEWQFSLARHIEKNQELHRALWPPHAVAKVTGHDYWTSKWYYVHQADASWSREKVQTEAYTREGELTAKSLDAVMAVPDLPEVGAVANAAASETGPAAGEVCQADLTRDKGIHMESYGKEEFRAMFATLEQLTEDILKAAPATPGLAKPNAKKRAAEESEDGSKAPRILPLQDAEPPAPPAPPAAIAD